MTLLPLYTKLLGCTQSKGDPNSFSLDDSYFSTYVKELGIRMLSSKWYKTGSC